MPAKLVITNGPPFKKFIFLSTLFSDDDWILTFDLDPKKSGGRKQITFTVMFIGRQLECMVLDEDQYSFIGFDADIEGKRNYFVGRYNTRTRQGECAKMAEKELLITPIDQFLF